jgi:tetratricopeptide (TPR) repeat protein
MHTCLRGARFAPLVCWLALIAWGQQAPAVEDVLRHAIELHQAGQVTAAIAEYRAYLKQVPGNVIARSNLGAALSRAGLYEEAIVEYNKALESQPGNASVRLNLALAYYKSTDISKAADEAARVVNAQPSNQQATLLLADCYLRMGENKKVIEILSPLEDQLPDHKGLLYMLGTALIRDEQPSRGQRLVDRILRDGDSAEARVLMGATKLSVQDFAGALVDFKKAVELNPSFPDLYSYYGMALAATGDTPAAAVAFRKELQANPNDYTSNIQMGILLKQDESYAEARKCFLRASTVRPGDAAARYQVATLDLLDGHTEQARVELEKLTAEIPQFVEAHVSLATAYYRVGRKADADKERAIVLRLNAEKQAAEPGAKGK